MHIFQRQKPPKGPGPPHCWGF